MADNKKEVPLNIISLLEQFESSVVNFAPIVSSYYNALVQDGAPPELAAKLVIEWHNLFWAMRFNQDKK